MLKGGTLTSTDTSTDGHTPEERPGLQSRGRQHVFICALLVKDGRFVASFTVHGRLPRVWASDEIALVEEVADRIWATLEHHKAEAELRANEERLAFLLRLNDALRPLSDPVDVQEAAARPSGRTSRCQARGYAEIEGRNTSFTAITHGVPPLPGGGQA